MAGRYFDVGVEEGWRSGGQPSEELSIVARYRRCGCGRRRWIGLGPWPRPERAAPASAPRASTRTLGRRSRRGRSPRRRTARRPGPAPPRSPTTSLPREARRCGWRRTHECEQVRGKGARIRTEATLGLERPLDQLERRARVAPPHSGLGALHEGKGRAGMLGGAGESQDRLAVASRPGCPDDANGLTRLYARILTAGKARWDWVGSRWFHRPLRRTRIAPEAPSGGAPFGRVPGCSHSA